MLIKQHWTVKVLRLLATITISAVIHMLQKAWLTVWMPFAIFFALATLYVCSVVRGPPLRLRPPHNYVLMYFNSLFVHVLRPTCIAYVTNTLDFLTRI